MIASAEWQAFEFNKKTNVNRKYVIMAFRYNNSDNLLYTNCFQAKQGSLLGPVWTGLASLNFQNVAFGYQG